MSDTPRTDAEIVQFGDGPAKYVYAAFASELEREIAKLRADNESLLQSNRQLRQAVGVLLDEPVNSL